MSHPASDGANAVLVAAFEEGGAEEDWADWTGASMMSEKPGFLSATLYKGAGDKAAYKYAVRVEVEQAGDEEGSEQKILDAYQVGHVGKRVQDILCRIVHAMGPGPSTG